MTHAPSIAVAKVAAAVLASSWATLTAAPAGADPIYDKCLTLPAGDACHVLFNVPVDPAAPPEEPAPPYNPYNDPSNSLSPLYSQPTMAQAPAPLPPVAAPPTFSPDFSQQFFPH